MGWIKGIAGALVIAASFVLAVLAGVGVIFGVVWLISLLSFASVIANVILGILIVLVAIAVIGLLFVAAESVKDNGFRQTFKDAWRDN